MTTYTITEAQRDRLLDLLTTAVCNDAGRSDGFYQSGVDLLQSAQPVAQPLELSDEEINEAWRSVDYTQPYHDFQIAIARAVLKKASE